MNRNEAKAILVDYRSDIADGRTESPEVRGALQMVEHDPDLAAWFERQQRFHRSMRDAFRSIDVDPAIKDAILERSKTVEGVVFRLDARRLALIACVGIAAVVLAAVLWMGRTGGDDDGFLVFRSRMVRTVLREYQMDIETNQVQVVRDFLAGNGAPSDFELSPGLAEVPVFGGGVLRWRGDRVAMVCLAPDNDHMLFVFVADQATFGASGPPASPAFERVNRLNTASWTSTGRVYLVVSAMRPDRFADLFKG